MKNLKKNFWFIKIPDEIPQTLVSLMNKCNLIIKIEVNQLEYKITLILI